MSYISGTDPNKMGWWTDRVHSAKHFALVYFEVSAHTLSCTQILDPSSSTAHYSVIDWWKNDTAHSALNHSPQIKLKFEHSRVSTIVERLTVYAPGYLGWARCLVSVPSDWSDFHSASSLDAQSLSVACDSLNLSKSPNQSDLLCDSIATLFDSRTLWLFCAIWHHSYVTKF